MQTERRRRSMKKNELIQGCSDAQKGVEISIKLLRTLGVIISEIKKFLTEVDLDSEQNLK